MPTIMNFYSSKEILRHTGREDCWVIIDEKVYNVTDYLDEHPGGDDVLLNVAGKDATEEFEDAGHSKSARLLMQDYCIGELDPSPVIPELEIISKEQNKNIVKKLMDKKTLQYWVFPAAIVGISVAVGLLYLCKK